MHGKRMKYQKKKKKKELQRLLPGCPICCCELEVAVDADPPADDDDSLALWAAMVRERTRERIISSGSMAPL